MDRAGSTGVIRPRLRDSVLVFGRDDLVQFVGLSDLRVCEFRVQPFVPDLIPMLDGTRTEAELLDDLANRHAVRAQDLSGVLQVLRDERLVDRAVPAPVPEGYRYERQERFFDELIASHDHLPASSRQLQRRLAAARVTVIGTGGAGGWVLQALAATGVGRLILVDADVVALSNLNRQILFTGQDVGRPKVEVAAERLTQLNPDLQVVGRQRMIVEVGDLAEVLDDTDLVISCADEPDVYAVSDVVAEAAQRRGVPHIVGGAYGANLGIPGTSVIPQRTTCWACLRAATRDDHERSTMTPLLGRRRSAGSIAPVAGMIGNLMAWDAVRILLGLPPGLAGQVRELDLLSLQWRVREVPPRADCARCGPVDPEPGP